MRLIIESDETVSTEYSSTGQITQTVQAPPEFRAVEGVGGMQSMAGGEAPPTGIVQAPPEFRAEPMGVGDRQSLIDDQF
ncbi:hypothetical protein SAMN05421858_2352 [Haladaptatus litoreus]|uniref:Uncharacterized protein n=1 Tax=Haladaptatus litoreus TaxID=553468 RepID=A0A1N7B5M8_9EURY|nr:hypothetical protein [Haladaptatus litoreus]SIR46649.1 hypothetical protein SAMN05421858_2352 [Haladaptatus litoreus]